PIEDRPFETANVSGSYVGQHWPARDLLLPTSQVAIASRGSASRSSAMTSCGVSDGREGFTYAQKLFRKARTCCTSYFGRGSPARSSSVAIASRTGDTISASLA